MLFLKLKSVPGIFIVLLCSVVLATLFSFVKYYITKDYYFLVETPCNPADRTCYIRDCSDGWCPPNELAEYTIYSVPAHLFENCSDNTCTNVCSQSDLCEEVVCENNEEDECSTQ